MKSFEPKQFKYFVFIALFFVGYALFMSWQFRFQIIDDAYISFRYGKNLMDGSGLVFNRGEYVEGYTNFLWTLITAPFTKLAFADISFFAVVIGIFFSVLSLFLIYKVTLTLKGFFTGETVLALFFPSILLAVDNSAAFWAAAGMETPLFIFFILLIIYYYFRINEDNKFVYYLAASSIFCTLTRPEGNLVFALLFIHLLFFRKQINDSRKKLLILISVYAVFAALYYSFKYFYYGSIIPNTFYAKGAADIGDNLFWGYFYIKFGLKARAFILLFLFIVPFKYLKEYKISFLYLFTAAYLSYVVYVGGDWIGANRFILPVIPAVYILAVLGLSNLIYSLRTVKFFTSYSFNNLFLFFVILLTASALYNTAAKLEYEKWINERHIKFQEACVSIGKHLKKTVPANTKIAVGPAGKIPYYSDLYSIDMWGLNDKKIASLETRSSTTAHKKFDFQYVLSLKPDIIIGYTGFSDIDVPADYEKIESANEENGFLPIFKLKTN